jgi:LysR family hydrogen peroxide-inducible transcriptional activator
MRLTPHPYTLRQIQYAAAVAETLSFRRAAERCRVSQPSLSAQLAELEASLQVRLFERNRRSVLVTPAGAALLGRARRLLVEADELLLAAQTAGDFLSGRLRLGIIPTIAPYLLPWATPLLRRSWRNLSVVWVEDRTAALMGSLRQGDLDAAVLALEAELGDVEHEVIAKDPFLLAGPPGHPLLRRRSAVTMKELRDVGVLLLTEGHCLREQALGLCAASKARELEFRATSLPTLVQMVAAGNGVTLLPSLAVPAETRRARLLVRPFAPPAPHRTLALVWRPGSALAEALRKVVSVLREAWVRASAP